METIETLRAELDEVRALVEENNSLLKKMRRDAIIGTVAKFVIWAVLLVASFYLSAKFLEPYLGMLEGAQEGGQAQDLGSLMQQYRDLVGQ